MGKEKIKILFVCMGNICRSPTAEGTFRSQVKKQGVKDLFEIDSAGTHAKRLRRRKGCQKLRDIEG